ncbi:MAG: 5'/3'-nucleotidase SurE [Hyphomicrobiales bacterium]
MRILITNDDGIEAPGLDVLHKIASELSDDVWVVAPETDQSGASHSLTLHEPLRLRKLKDKVYAVKGTPTDCVIMGVRFLMPESPPALVLSGVNRGQNMADDVTYSGTVAGAMEGTLLGIRSIALSLAYRLDDDPEGDPEIHWETPMKHGAPLIRRLLETGWDKGVVLNINFPDRTPDRVKGIAITRQGRRDQDLLRVEDRMDTRGNPYYWFGFSRRRSNPPEGTDLWAVYGGQISVTPLKLNLTHGGALDTLAGHFGGGALPLAGE